MNGSLPLVSRAIAKAMLTICLVSLLLTPASAQNFSFDARAAAMGGMNNNNDASRLAGETRAYSSFVLPFGLIHVFKERNIFNPGDDAFNPIKAMELLASPLHVTFNRDEGDAKERLIRDIINSGLSRDLNAYRGFVPKSTYTGAGLVSPTWGKTIRVFGEKNSNKYHGVYIGAGPYLSVGTDATIDPELINLLASSTDIYSPNRTFLVQNTTDGQLAGAIALGYRVHVPLPSNFISGSDRDGVYVAATYNYLRGFHYDTAFLNVRFDTDATGRVTLAPTTVPVIADHEYSSKGKGYAMDLATAVVKDRVEVRFSSNGIGNRIEWDNLKTEQYVLRSLFQGANCVANTGLPPSAQNTSNCFVQTQKGTIAGTRTIKLPVRYSVGSTYTVDRWTIDADYMRGLQKSEFQAGTEYRLGRLEFRGGTRYLSHLWQPTGGVGLNVTQGFGVDLAFFGTATNIERIRKATMAVSLRFNRENP